ncbi:hypothetical protein Godav_023266 [Gossypium davidsonii]|uniref:Pentatricopeptide repeat-containing protein n=1 Tax=Gossypium davidsonii TaxID=34287 RepID=A0A7J8SRX1_GOSDV|nr:hypothetical protein [Gossypium davidsonii]
MPEKGCLPNEFITLLHGYCRKGKLSEANAIVNEMMRNGCVPNTCNIFLHSLWKEGKILEAEEYGYFCLLKIPAAEISIAAEISSRFSAD